MIVGGGLAGGYQSVGVSQHHKDLVSKNIAKINTAVGGHATSYTIDKAWSQVVAGTNYHFNLTSNDNHKYTVTIYEPLPHTHSPAEVSSGSVGHSGP
jgi:hypothetical protein